MKELSKAYEAKKYEDAIYKRWEQSGFFDPDVCIKKRVSKKTAKPFSIVLPPPNVTGTLHMGHAVMLAVQDVMIRYHRMKGEITLWLPGTDHAAIATQTKVEKMIFDAEHKTRQDMGREAFLRRVEQFARESHDTIVNQCKKMGASLDWSREAFTLDDARTLAVRTMFKQMYDDGIIYRGDRIVNWDPVMQSNVSDDEIEWKEETTAFYYLKYGPFVIGTARPETKFGDKYIVMHPDDQRYKKYQHGQKLEADWLNGKITATIVKDKAADMAFGTGVMTITPWHDATDFDIALRHKLDREQIIDYNGKLLPIAGEFAGLDIVEARPKIIEKLKTRGLLETIDEKYVHRVATNYRGGGVIEPQIRKQWFIGVTREFQRGGKKVTLKKLMQAAVKNGDIEIIPDRFNKTYFHWIDNLRDWCISRQIWYGHRVPVWYRGNEVFCGVQSPKGAGWEQDPDTLDTWFSSGLWTFSTLGWPKKTKDLVAYHPTSVLETGYDILFFWVARMILMTTYALGKVPFQTVYLHGLVRDEQGRKMSKSLGNIIDPLDMISQFGTDATRLSLIVGNTPGNDMKLSEAKVAGFRNFTNKLWNVARFMLLNVKKPKVIIQRPQGKTLADKWILVRLTATIQEVTTRLEAYNFSLAGETLRRFTWDELADWYLEIAKVEGNKDRILNYILNTILKLWHPFMPFVTEAIWQEVYRGKTVLLGARWPEANTLTSAKKITQEFALMQSIVIGLRAIRSDYRIDPANKIPVLMNTRKQKKLLQTLSPVIRDLARTGEMTVATSVKRPVASVAFVVQTGVEVFVDLLGVVDKEKERMRLQKEIDTLAPYVASLEKKLSNEQFVTNAPSSVVDEQRRKLNETREKLSKIIAQQKSLS